MVSASPNPKKRVVVWNQLLSLAPPNNEPWVLRGDLNAIVSTNERRGGARNGSLGVQNLRGEEGIFFKGLIDALVVRSGLICSLTLW
ncbi:hypothetical protein GOBAR_DD19967 [Gossypium barbadense]|nr:hypothetical protein GOBAR_DD19967 [Gossypium barbadense]